MKKNKLRSVNTHFWDDPYIINLDQSEKLLFLYFLTNNFGNLIGVYEISLRQISFDTGFDKDMLLTLINRFSKDKKILYTQNYIILVNYIKNQNYNKNMIIGADNLIDNLPEEIKQFIFDKGLKGFERIRKGSKGFGRVRKGSER